VIRRADFVETAIKLQDITGFTDGLSWGITANAFHGRVPGCDPTVSIQLKDAFGQRIDNLGEKPAIPNVMNFR
jgi:hypothetical protein